MQLKLVKDNFLKGLESVLVQACRVSCGGSHRRTGFAGNKDQTSEGGKYHVALAVWVDYLATMAGRVRAEKVLSYSKSLK